MKKMKSQAAFEFIMLAGVMMAIFVMFFAIASEKIVEMNEVRRDTVANDIKDTVIAEIELAQGSLDGYTREFSLPEYVEGNTYEIAINTIGQSNILSIIYQDEVYNYDIPVPMIAGSRVYKGVNTIQKLQGGEIYIESDVNPCEGLQIGDNSYCIGGGCYCYSGNYVWGESYGSADNLCEHENDFRMDCNIKGCINFDYCNPPPGLEPDESVPYKPSVTISDITDTTAKLSFTTNESATAVVRYDEFGVSCPSWGSMNKEASDSAPKKSFVMDLTDMHAGKKYCFRMQITDPKGAVQEFSDGKGDSIAITSNIAPNDNTFTTTADVSAPLVRYANIYPTLAGVNYHNYNERVEIFVNITDDTATTQDIERDTTAAIKQVNDDGSETTVQVLDNLKDTDIWGNCRKSGLSLGDGTIFEEVYDDDGYLGCFDVNNIFAQTASYSADTNTLFYASYDTNFDPDFADANTITTTNLLEGDTEDLSPGRFGNGVKVDDGIPPQILSYSAANNINLNEGTIEFWIKPENAQGIQYLFYGDGGIDKFLLFKIGNSLTFSVTSALPLSAGISAGVWQFAAITWRNFNSGSADAEMHVYVNGNEIGVLTGETVNIPSINDIYVGSHPAGLAGVYNANSVIDQFRILNIAKTQPEIQEDYETERTYNIYFDTTDRTFTQTYGPGDYSESSFKVNYKVP